VNSIPPELAIFAVGGGLALVLYTVFVHAYDRSVVRDSLRSIDGGMEVVENIRDRELLNPLRDRAMAPVLEAMTKLGRRFTPVGYVDGVRHKFVLAGRYTTEAVDRFLAIRVGTVVAIPATFWFVLMWNPLGLTGLSQKSVFLLLAVALLIGPDARLNRSVDERQRAIRLQLPDIMDLLTISVEAGLGFEQALDRTIAAVPGPLTEEFSRMLGEIRAGETRAGAMRSLEARVDLPEFRSFVLAILQADTFGISIGRVLRAQADEMRIRRRQQAQERAMKAPVKMLIPMVFCIFPALFVVVIGPAMINISKNF
jgi:tight adherence protein C